MKLGLLKIYNAFVSGLLLATASLFVSPLHELVTNEASFLSILTMAIIIDLLVGAAKHWKMSNFSFKHLVLGLMIKVFVAYGGILLCFAFQNLDPGIASDWFGLLAKFTVLLYPAGSAFSSMYVLTNGKFPPLGFMKKLKSFNDSTSPGDVMEPEQVKK